MSSHVPDTTLGDVVDAINDLREPLRDYFAAHALMGMLVAPMSGASPEFIVAVAYEFADAMLKERAK